MTIKISKTIGIIVISLFSATNAASASSNIEYKNNTNNFTEETNKQNKLLLTNNTEQTKNNWLSQNTFKVTDITSNAKKVPAPAAILLFGPALLGLLGMTGLKRTRQDL